jgi:antitoxin ParD1/3/4
MCAGALNVLVTTSSSVREALRLMGDQDQMRAMRLEQLRGEIRKGLDSGVSEVWGAESVKRQARAHKAAKAPGRK